MARFRGHRALTSSGNFGSLAQLFKAFSHNTKPLPAGGCNNAPAHDGHDGTGGVITSPTITMPNWPEREDNHSHDRAVFPSRPIRSPPPLQAPMKHPPTNHRALFLPCVVELAGTNTQAAWAKLPEESVTPLGVLIGRPQGSAMAPQALPPGTMEVQVGQVPRLVVMGRPRLTTTEVCPCNLGIASRGKLSTATPWCHGHARGHTTCRTALSR